MQSIQYITTVGSWITGLAAAGITFSCIRDGFSYYLEGKDAEEIIQQISKKLRAGVILLLMTALIEFFKKYWS